MPICEPNSLDTDVSVILVCWNNKSYLEQCLESIFDNPPRCNTDIVVVDNGSTDGSQAMLSERFPSVKIIQNQENVGLGRASNQGIQATRGRYVLLLNNDTIMSEDSIDAMSRCLDDDVTVGAVGGTLLNSDLTVQSCYNRFPTLLEEFLIATRIGEALWPGYPAAVKSDTRLVDWMSSACLMLRRASLDEVGLLDEEYFIYGDEADLQYRLHRAGWRRVHLHDVKIVHFGGRSMNRWSRRKMVYRGKMLFFRKNYGKAKEIALRALLSGLTVAKVAVWAVAYVFPKARPRAQKELKSNMEVVRLCHSLQ